MISLAEIWQAWQHFFHDPQPVATLCVFRILFGLVLVFNGCTLLPFARDFFGPLGLLGIKRFAKAYPQARVSLFYFLPATDQSAVAMVLLQITASAAMVLGLATTISVPLAWLALVSLHHRNPVIFNAGDTVQRLLLLLLCFTPSGAALSKVKNPVTGVPNPIDAPNGSAGSVTICVTVPVNWNVRGAA